MINAIFGYLPLLEYGTAAANRSWNEWRMFSFATLPPKMNMILIAWFYFVSLMRLHHDDECVVMLWRDTTTLIQKTNNNKPSTHQTTIHGCDLIDKQCNYISWQVDGSIFVSPESIASTNPMNCRHQLLHEWLKRQKYYSSTILTNANEETNTRQDIDIYEVGGLVTILFQNV